MYIYFETSFILNYRRRKSRNPRRRNTSANHHLPNRTAVHRTANQIRTGDITQRNIRTWRNQVRKRRNTKDNHRLLNRTALHLIVNRTRTEDIAKRSTKTWVDINRTMWKAQGIATGGSLTINVVILVIVMEREVKGINRKGITVIGSACVQLYGSKNVRHAFHSVIIQS